MVNIRTINKGTKKYYYLEHTIRTNDGFKNKRLYLGNTLPKNISEIKDKFLYDLFEGLYDKELEAIKEFWNKEYRNYPASAKEKYIESFMIKFTYNTSKIEGSTLTLKETADLLQEQVTPKNKALKFVREAEAHKKIFYQMLENKNKLNVATILYWHKELFKEADPEIAGKIRAHPVAIARSKVELPLPAELNVLLKEFFEWYNKYYGKINPVLMAALVHLKFVSIHPFSDGNGRISRLMMNHTLNNFGYPMLNIEYANRSAYYTALERSQTRSKEETFMLYTVKRYLKEYASLMKKK
ncbi:MAG: Fic family protein [Candidatus Woesearchaeota archaeon]|nr:Fic family protein [Candidatus Woesearchaeota archaeon]